MTIKLNSTTYAVLALLSRRPWTAYELAKHMRSSLVHAFNGRAASHLYAEARNLKKQGLADVDVQYTGRRKSQRYSITEQGRTVLASWLRKGPSTPFQDEWETMLRVIFHDQGDREGLLDALACMQEELRAFLRNAAEGMGQVLLKDAFQPHFLLNAEVMELVVSIQAARLAWLRQLSERVERGEILVAEDSIPAARNRYLELHHRVLSLLAETSR